MKQTMKTKEITQFRKTYKDYDKQCYFEGLKLAVHFDEKDEVKKWGAQWDVDDKFWWMPANQLTKDVHAGIGTVKDWLNDHKMIVGQYGKFNDTANSRNIFSDEADHFTEYGLYKSNNEPKFKVQFFYNHDVAKFIPTGMGDLASEYLTLEDGRKRWDEAINNGYNRVENS
jgi:hypothetical protein